jgi:hypothetical protein
MYSASASARKLFPDGVCAFQRICFGKLVAGIKAVFAPLQ